MGVGPTSTEIDLDHARNSGRAGSSMLGTPGASGQANGGSLQANGASGGQQQEPRWCNSWSQLHGLWPNGPDEHWLSHSRNQAWFFLESIGSLHVFFQGVLCFDWIQWHGWASSTAKEYFAAGWTERVLFKNLLECVVIRTSLIN